MTDSKNCKYCSLPESVTEPCLACTNCDCSAHISCLKTVSFPGGLLGDVFFKLTCDECSGNRIEHVTRDKISWYVGLLAVS